MFTPSLEVKPQRETKNNSPWHIPGSPIHTQQTPAAPLVGMINAAYQAVNHSDPPPASDRRIRTKPSSVQYLVSSSTSSPCHFPPRLQEPHTIPFWPSYRCVETLPLLSQALVGSVRLRTQFLACDQGVYARVPPAQSDTRLALTYSFSPSGERRSTTWRPPRGP